MPRLIDDPRSLAALTAYLRAHAELHDEYRRKLADAVVARVAQALAVMDGAWSDAAIREALLDWDQVVVDLSLEYIHAALVRSGEIEAAKRLGEIRDLAGEDLPANLAAAGAEVTRAGLEA